MVGQPADWILSMLALRSELAPVDPEPRGRAWDP